MRAATQTEPMLTPDDTRWLQAAINDLNNLLQVADESADSLGPLCQDSEAKKYFEFLQNSLDRASGVTTQLAAWLNGQPMVLEKPASPPVQHAATHGIEIANADSGQELIMVIDDEPMVNMLASEMLTGAGYRVVSALEPFRALEIFGKIGNDIDLVVLDFTLPIMDGSEVFHELQKLRPKVPVMLSSGFAEQKTLSAMLARGLRGFLPKPYTEEKLLNQVRSTLETLRQERSGNRRFSLGG
jgi:CheY-like chemotaxis protein